MTGEDQTAIFSFNGGNGLPERLGAYDSLTVAEDRSADFVTGLVSLGFIKTAIRRRARFWCFTAVIGLLVGCAFYVSRPHPYQASTSLLLTLGPYENVTTAAVNDQAMAQSRAVANLAARELGVQPGSLFASYSVAPITERVLLITASAPSSDQAILRANAVATAFLQFRADEMQAEEKLQFASLNQQVNDAQQSLSSINAQINQLSAQPTSPTQQSQLSSLRTERLQTTATLNNLEQAILNDQVTVQSATTAAVKDSVVLDAAVPLRHSRLKPLVYSAAIGLVMGLALGIGIVVVQALVSDKLRRREDVAQALGAPVKLSVGTVRPKRWAPGRRWRSVRDADIQRIAAYLGRAVPENSRRVAALAVVPVDDLQVPALSLVSLAVSCAEQGKEVVVADLCTGAPAARLLGVKEPGVRMVSAQEGRLVVAVPERGDLVPVGPLGRGSAPAQGSSFSEAVAAACASANLLITLATLDPSLGGEHLATWATDAVVVVTAGRSSWTKVEGAGELVRLSGTRLVSAVLVGADKTDESLGVRRTPETV